MKMETLKSNNAEVFYYCRTCMCKLSEEIFGLFDEINFQPKAADILNSCTSIRVEVCDSFSKKICLSCYKNLMNFFEFRKKAESVNSKLLQSNNKLTNTLLFNSSNDKIAKHEQEIDDTVNNHVQENNKDTIEIGFFKIEDDLSDNDSLNVEVTKSNQYKIKYSPSNIEVNCPSCSKKFKHIKEMVAHICDINSDEGTEVTVKREAHDYELYPSSSCDSVMAYDEVYNKSTVLRCSVCEEIFMDRSCLQRHELECKQYKSDRDQDNNKNTTEAIEINSKSIHDNYSCEICFTSFKSMQALSAHTKIHVDKNRVLSCAICQKVFKKLSHLKRHKVCHMDDAPYKCLLCPKSFFYESVLSEHMGHHVGLKPHVCDICNKSFSYLSSLNTHKRIHSGNFFLCGICGNQLTSVSNLKQHMKRHQGEKSFSCDACPKKFVSKGELDFHQTRHTGERRFTCDECGATFTRLSSINMHKTTVHMGIKRYTCPVCDRQFSSSSHLTRHNRIHTGEKPYKCDFCDRAFTQSNDLKKHSRSHTGYNMYNCDVCLQKFRLKSDLTEHIKSSHSNPPQYSQVSYNESVNAPNGPTLQTIIDLVVDQRS